MAKRRARKTSTRTTRRRAPRKPAKPRRKAWSLLIYMCGDSDTLEGAINDDFRELCQVGSTEDIHVEDSETGDPSR